MHLNCINLPCIFKFDNPQSVLSTSLIHHFGAAWYKVSRRGPKHNSERGNAKSNPLPLMSKGEEEQTTGGRAGKQEEKTTGERAGKQRKCIAINAKGGDCWKCCH